MLELNKIYNMDCHEGLKLIDDESIDIILTSPPYNFGMDYKSTDDSRSWDDYFNTLFEIFKEFIRVLKNGGRLIINVQPNWSANIPTHH